MEKLKSGMKFNEVAAQYSEDKARQRGMVHSSFKMSLIGGHTAVGIIFVLPLVLGIS